MFDVCFVVVYFDVVVEYCEYFFVVVYVLVIWLVGLV